MNTNSSRSSSSKSDRKTIEKNRRNQMKNLYSQLYSLVPHHASSSGEPSTLPDQIDDATNYIKKLQEDVEELKQTRDGLLGVEGRSKSNGTRTRTGTLNSPVQIEVHEKGSALEVTLVTGLECQFVFNEAIRILHEEQAEVVNASYTVAEGTVFHTIHAQIGEAATSYGAARITERLKKFAL